MNYQHKDTPESFWERMALVHGEDVRPRWRPPEPDAFPFAYSYSLALGASLEYGRLIFWRPFSNFLVPLDSPLLRSSVSGLAPQAGQTRDASPAR